MEQRIFVWYKHYPLGSSSEKVTRTILMAKVMSFFPFNLSAIVKNWLSETLFLLLIYGL
jgi:hypothetical protein